MMEEAAWVDSPEEVDQQIAVLDGGIFVDVTAVPWPFADGLGLEDVLMTRPGLMTVSATSAGLSDVSVSRPGLTDVEVQH